ncbi:MAG: DegQ family serine endoprotease [Sedimentisphaerales bacterium]|nr:DegQ family serine endoprotease [Sedimentisphaerales bacterium]
MKTKSYSTLMLVFLAGLMLPAYSGAAAEDPLATLELMSRGFNQVADQAIPAVVFVQVAEKIKVRQPTWQTDPFGPFGDDFFERFFGQPRYRDRDEDRQSPRQQPREQEFKQRGQGSGFIIASDGLILTNHHVVGKADEIEVKLKDGRTFDAELIGSDEKTDVAVIRIKDSDFNPDKENLPTLPLGDSDDLRVGEWVLAIGSPFGLTSTVTAGVVSAKGRNVGVLNLQDAYENFIQTDAAINPGNSGGPLLNLKGEVVGLNTAIFSRSGGYMGIGFAIPINMAKFVKDQLLEHGEVKRGQLGIMIQQVDDDMAKALDIEAFQGILVQDVLDDSPAEKAGLKQGDVIIKLNGRNVEGVPGFRSKISMMPPGEKVELTIMRDGKEKEIDVTIGEMDEKQAARLRAGESGGTEKLGLEVEDLSPEAAETYGFDNDEKGVIITHVAADSVAAEKGLRPGQLITSVNRREISNVEEFLNAVEEGTRNNTVLLVVKDRRGSRLVALPLED